MDAIRLVEAAQLKKDRAGFAPGDTVRVHVKVIEGEKERLQLFEGIVIRRRGEGGRASFTVRRISYGVGVERTFPLHSPRIERVDVARRSRVRRSKLYYLRSLAGPPGAFAGSRTRSSPRRSSARCSATSSVSAPSPWASASSITRRSIA